ncbi:mRNA decay protein [Dipsacomyces acuminosporus]|nr:mRNA decay protein [Dipsacomyces acuminosporus]
MGQDSAAQLLREVKLLKLEKYVSEVVPAAAEGLLKCRASADVGAAIDIMSSLHARFPLLFTVQLIIHILKSLAPPVVSALAAMSPEQREKEEQSRLARQKTLLRIAGEMYLCGLFWGVDSLSGGVDGLDRASAFLLSHPSTANGASASSKVMAKVKDMVQQPGHCVFVGILQNLFLTDKEHHLSIMLATSVAKSFKEDFALTDDDSLDHSACSANNSDLPASGDGDSSDEHVVTADGCKRVKAILSDYCDTAISHLADMHKALAKMRRNKEEKMFNKGAVYADFKEKIERHTKSFERFSESVSILCEALAREPPRFDDHADDESKLDINFDGPVGPSNKDSSLGPWDDEDERLFYETTLDLQSRLPPSMLTSSRKRPKNSSIEDPSNSSNTDASAQKYSGTESEKDSAEKGADQSETAGPAAITTAIATATATAGAADNQLEDINEDNIDIGALTNEGAYDEDMDADVNGGVAVNAIGLMEYQMYLKQRKRTEESHNEKDSSKPSAPPQADPEPSTEDIGAGAASSTTLAAADDTDGRPGGGLSKDASDSTLTIVQQTGTAKEVTHAIAPLKFSDILRRLPTFTSKEGADEAAVDFCYVNNKANRAKLVQALVNVPRRQLYIVPYYARFIAALHPYFPEVGEGVIEELSHEFRWLTKKRFKDLQETRLKNIKYISELTKFKVAPLHVPFHCAKVLLEQFHVQNLEVLCSLLEQCGRFLLAQPETSARVSSLLDILMRKRQVLNLDDRTNQLIENAFRTCRPAALSRGQTAKYRTPYEGYIRKLVYEDLSRHTADRVCFKLRKLPWNDHTADDAQRVKRTLVSCFSKIWKIKHSNVYLVTMIANALGRLHPWFRVAVVDTVLENIKLGLEHNLFSHSQRRVSEIRYVGEMFIYKFISSKEIFDLLFLLVRYGHAEPHPFPGRDSEIDPLADYFRIRLVCTLLSTCGRYISGADDRLLLEEFAVYFQMYYLAKQQPIPIDIDYSIDQMYETIFPRSKQYTAWADAAQAMNELAQARAHATQGQQAESGASGDAAAASSSPDLTDGHGEEFSRSHSALSMGLGLSNETAEATEDSGSDADGKMDADTADESGGGSDGGSDGESDSAQEDDQDAERLRKEEEEMEEAHRQLEAMEALLEKEEEDRLEREFNKLMIESIDSRKNERSGKLDVGIPMHLMGKSSTSDGSQNAPGLRSGFRGAAAPDDGSESPPSNAIKFSLLTGKKQRPVIREVDIPVESQIAQKLRLQEEATQREKANLKKIVLNYERREADEQQQLYQKELAVSRARPGYMSASVRAEAAVGSPAPRTVPGSTFIRKAQAAASRKKKPRSAHESQGQQQRTTLHTRIPDHFL